MDDSAKQFSWVLLLNMFKPEEIVKSSFIVLFRLVTNLVLDEPIVVLLGHYYELKCTAKIVSTLPSCWLAGVEVSHLTETTMKFLGSC